MEQLCVILELLPSISRLKVTIYKWDNILKSLKNFIMRGSPFMQMTGKSYTTVGIYLQ